MRPKSRFTFLIAALAALTVLAACGEKKKKKVDAPESAKPQARAVMPGALGGSAAGGPAAQGAGGAVVGEVLETMDASSYTYAKLKTATGEQWAAGPKTTIAVGDRVTARDAVMMDGFESKTLGRKFDKILFAAAFDTAGDKAGGGTRGPMGSPHGAMANPHGAMANPHGAMANPHGAKGAMGGAAMGGAAMGGAAMGGAAMGGASRHMKVPKAEVAPVPKAEGDAGRTVAEIHAQAAALAGRPVAVRGVVTKFSPGILGRNWIHIQDATGDPKAGTHDLTVTTQAAVKKGDTILVEGTLAADKDFGAGYRYKVIVEEAKVTPHR